MKSEATLEFINKVQRLVTPNEFEQIKFMLFTVREEYHKSFAVILYAGYSLQTAFNNYKKLYWFTEKNHISYTLSIRMITNVAKYCEEGLSIKDLSVYELN